MMMMMMMMMMMIIIIIIIIIIIMSDHEHWYDHVPKLVETDREAMIAIL
jgi:hypothetical protein